MTEKRVAIVTGNRAGIGEAIDRVSRQGWPARRRRRALNADKLNAVVSTITASGGSAEALTC